MSWGAAETGGEESTGPVPPHCSKNVCPSRQGLLTSDPDLELLLNKISTVNHLLSSLEKKVPDPHPDARLGKPGWVRGEHGSAGASGWGTSLIQQTPHLN